MHKILPARAIAAASALPAPLVLALRQIPVPAFAVLLVVLFSGRLVEADIGAVSAALGDLAAWQWLVAAALAAVSFWAVGRYDALVHRHLRSGRGEAEARRAGLLAIAIGQTAGFGLLTGALVRLRMLPGLHLSDAVRITLAVTAMFLIGWAVVTALVVLAFPSDALRALRPFAWAVVAAAPVGLGLCLWRPRLTVAGCRLRLPTLPTLAQSTGLAAVDTLAAGLCLAVLMPPEAGVEIAVLLPVFLIAFGAGLVSGTPGGMGAFELTLLALLPAALPEPLLAGVLAWRVVYYAAPALIALCLLARGPAMAARARPAPLPVAPGLPLPSGLEALIDASRRAEAGLLRQGDKLFLSVPRTRRNPGQAAVPVGGSMLARTGQSLTMIGDPLGATPPGDAIAALTGAARREGRIPCLYKVGARGAVAARQAGWAVLPVAMEAWLRPATFRLDTPERRQLRRKLRKAETEGLRVTPAPLPLPLAEMAAVARAWSEERGSERGLSMGRFAADYVGRQRVFLAREKCGTLVGFLTCHATRREWTLDLMRALPEAPDGTMQALLARAIEDAVRQGCPRFSLAALPHPRIEALAARLPKALHPGAAADGLARFKIAFAPDWEPLYLAAPSWAGLAIAALDLVRAISRPAPLAADGLIGRVDTETFGDGEAAPTRPEAGAAQHSETDAPCARAA